MKLECFNDYKQLLIDRHSSGSAINILVTFTGEDIKHKNKSITTDQFENKQATFQESLHQHLKKRYFINKELTINKF